MNARGWDAILQDVAGHSPVVPLDTESVLRRAHQRMRRHLGARVLEVAALAGVLTIGGASAVRASPPLQTPDHFEALPIDGHAALVTWRVVAGATGYTLERINRGDVHLGATTSSYVDEGLRAATLYSYRITATKGPSRSAKSAIARVSFPDTDSPTTPDGLRAVADPAGVALSWQPATDDVGVTGYTLYRDGAALTTIADGGTSYHDQDVGPSRTYHYAVDAFDAAGNHSRASTAVGVDTLPVLPGAPETPSGVRAKAEGPEEVHVSWAPSDDPAVAGYTVYRDGIRLATVVTHTTTYEDVTVGSGTTYVYRVDAFDASGRHSSLSAPARVTTPRLTGTSTPTAPTGLVADATTRCGAVVLSWQPSSDPAGVTAYAVFRNDLRIATVRGSTLSYTDRSVSANTPYTYAVEAFNAAGNHSEESDPATATPRGPVRCAVPL